MRAGVEARGGLLWMSSPRRWYDVLKCSRRSGSSSRRGFGIGTARRGWHLFCGKEGEDRQEREDTVSLCNMFP